MGLVLPKRSSCFIDGRDAVRITRRVVTTRGCEVLGGAVNKIDPKPKCRHMVLTITPHLGENRTTPSPTMPFPTINVSIF